jgi:hypothetical protein
MKKITIIALLIMVVTIGQAIAGPNYVVGNISNYSAVASGLLIMVDTGIPDNCAGSPYNWMIIANEDKAMLAMALMRISQDQMGVALYSAGVFYNGICRVTQYDPN